MKPQVVILAAGASSRFFPFNQADKSLHMVMDRPIIAYTLDSIAAAGFTDVIVVIPSDDTSQTLIASSAPSGLNLQFATLSSPGGQGEAILAAAPLITDNFIVLNSQQLLFHQQLEPHRRVLERQDIIGFTLRRSTDTPEKYGIFALEGDGVTNLVEKPSLDQAPSDQRLVGTYYLTLQFLDILKSVPKAEYSLEAAINQATREHTFLALPTTVDYPSLKYPWDLFKLKDTLLSSRLQDVDQPIIDPSATVASTATITGPVIIEAGAHIYDYALITGPTYIGPEAIVGSYCQVRKGSIIEAKAEIQRYADISNSQIMPGAHIHSGFIGDSIIGATARLSAGFITANRRLDRNSIRVTIKGQSVDTHLNYLGTFIGDNTNVGVRVTTMPGTIIGAGSVIGPGVTLKGSHPHNSTITASNL